MTLADSIKAIWGAMVPRAEPVAERTAGPQRRVPRCSPVSSPSGDPGPGSPGHRAVGAFPALPRRRSAPIADRATATGRAGRRLHRRRAPPRLGVPACRATADGRLDALARAPHQLVVIDLARDARSDYFAAQEIAALRASGKTVLAYFEIGSIEDFRPEYPALRRQAGDLIANRWDDWPDEYFVRYWDARWWDRVIAAPGRPGPGRRLRRRLPGHAAGLRGARPRHARRAQTGDGLARAMADLIMRISEYAKAAAARASSSCRRTRPSCARYPGYTAAIDGIGMEELFFLATDQPCTEDYCAENLATRPGAARRRQARARRRLRHPSRPTSGPPARVTGPSASPATSPYSTGSNQPPLFLNDARRESATCRKTIGVVGMGYVGLTLTAALARAGNTVYGVDVQPAVLRVAGPRPAAHLRARRRRGVRRASSGRPSSSATSCPPRAWTRP